MHWAKLLTSGADVWLNTPHWPFEASGTSGMKAALNGVPSLSVVDGLWMEGCLERTTDWAIGTDGDIQQATADETDSLYWETGGHHLQVLSAASRLRSHHAHGHRDQWIVFQSHRMLSQYVANA